MNFKTSFELTAFKLRGRAANYDENPLINKVGPWRNRQLEGHSLCKKEGGKRLNIGLSKRLTVYRANFMKGVSVSYWQRKK